MGKRIFDLSGIITLDGLEGVAKGLRDLGTQFQQTEKAFYKFGRQINTAGSKLTQSITVPVIAAAGAVTLAAKSFGEYGDKILDMSKASGLSTDTIQELKQVASDAGTDFDRFSESIFMITKNMPAFLKGNGAASETLRKLGVSVFDSNGKFRDSNVLFPEIIKKLQNIKGETNRTAAAQTIFGRKYQDVLDVLGMTNAEFDASRQKAHDLGLVMSGDALKAADDFRVAMNDATNQIVGMGRAALVDLLPIFKDTIFPLFRDSIIPVLKEMAEKVAGIVKWFNGLGDSTKKTILGMIGFVALSGPVLIFVGKLIGGIAATSAAMTTLRVAFLTFSAFMATNPLGAALLAVGLLTAAIIAVYAALDKSKSKKLEATNKQAIINERAELEKLNTEWKDRLAWLEKQKNPSAVMVEEMASLREGIKGVSEELEGLGGNAGVGIIDPDEEERRKKAIEAAKKRQEDIARINAEYEQKLFDNTLHSDEERYQREREFALIEVRKTKGDVALAAAALDAEHLKKVQDNADKELKIKREAAEKEKLDAADRDKAWTKMLLEQSGDKIAILKNEEAEAIKAAKGNEAEIAKIKKYYLNETEKAEKEAHKNAIERFVEKVQSYIDAIGNIGSGIAGIFSQATANKQMEIDNQQQAERDAIENSTMSEKEKRKAIAALDKKQDAEQRALRRKAAKESKNISIFESIMGTAQAVVNALASVAPPLNFVYAGIVGAIGAVKTALIAAQPLPLAAGALVMNRPGGVNAIVGEGSQPEMVFPVETGAQMMAKKIAGIIRDTFSPAMGGFALAGAGGGGTTVNLNIGNFLGTPHDRRELVRELEPYMTAESQRKGQA